ncbi:hypothetical protein L0244_38395 [bacterium]|nr:hypothetical protein [bacterium]
MKLLTSFVIGFVLLLNSVGMAQEHILLSALSTSKKLILLRIEYANKKYKVVDKAVFDLPVQGGTTAIAPLPNQRFQFVWTSGSASQGVSANSTNSPVKMKSMTTDSNLEQVGNTKTLSPVLSSYYNFEIYEDYNSATEKFTFQSQQTVVSINRNSTTGNPFGPKDQVFTIPGSANQFDTNFDGDLYSGLRFDGRYNFVCGNVNNAAPTLIVPFVGDVISSTMLPIPGTNNFNFTLMKRTNNPEKISVENFQINGATCQPIKNSIHLPPVNQNLGQLPFFNGITSTASETTPNGGHVFLIHSANGGTDILAYHINSVTGKKDSPTSKFVPDEIVDDPAELFLFGLFAEGVPF